MAMATDEATESWGIVDERDLPVFIHSELDDLGLTMEAFRVYGHLARRRNRNSGTSWPSYATIGETCFRANFPNASKATLRRKAIAAVKELTDNGLLQTRQRKAADGGNMSNEFVLTPRQQWKNTPLVSMTPPSVNDTPLVSMTPPSVNDTQRYTIEGTPKEGFTADDAVASSAAAPAPEPSPEKPKRQKPDITALLFDPAQDSVLVELLEAHYASIDRNPPRKFQNAAQRDGYRMAAQHLGPDRTRQAITQCIVGNRYALGQIVTSLLRWVDNDKRGGVTPRQTPPPPSEPRGFANLRKVVSELRGS